MTLLTLLALLGVTSCVIAQTGETTATCTYAEWTSFNGRSPCQIWANLQAACDPSASVGPLDTSSNSNAQYPAPSGSNASPCQCNVVAYNLMAGCSWCQPNVYSNNWVSESQWKSGCSIYNASGLPPQASLLSSQIPSWAFIVENGGPWLSFEASSVAVGGTAPTNTFGTFTSDRFGPTGTGFPTTGTASITGPFSGGNGDGGSDFNPGPTINLGKAIGIPVGIVLGCYVLVGGTVLAVFFTRQKNRKAWYGPTAQYYRNGGRTGEAGQPLLRSSLYGEQPNTLTTPSSTNSPTTLPPTSYHPNASYVHGGLGYNQGYGQQYYSVPIAQSGMHQTGPTQPVIHV